LGQCFDCHSADVQGDSAIDGVWLDGTGSREDIYDTIARGRAGICPPWIRKLDPATTRALAVLNYTAAPKAAAEGAPAVGTEAISSLSAIQVNLCPQRGPVRR
jgi:mono/diheme cytochrome c family protein